MLGGLVDGVGGMGVEVLGGNLLLLRSQFLVLRLQGGYRWSCIGWVGEVWGWCVWLYHMCWKVQQAWWGG